MKPLSNLFMLGFICFTFNCIFICVAEEKAIDSKVVKQALFIEK